MPDVERLTSEEQVANLNVFKYDHAREMLENASLGVRVMVLDSEFYESLVGNLTAVFQTGSQVILYQIGLAYGQLIGRRLLETGELGSSSSSHYARHYSSLGIGKFEYPPLEGLAAETPLKVTIGLRDSFFAKARGTTGQAECHIVRGMLEGTAKSVYGREFRCSEDKCVSKGDERCEFVVARVA